MPEQLIAIDGTTFALADRSGDINGGSNGFFAQDARYISRWQLTVGGHKPQLLTSHHVDPFSNMCFLSNHEAATAAAGTPMAPSSVSVLRRRVVGAGMEEEIELINHLSEHVAFEVRLNVDADFLDMFEVKALEFAPEDQVFAGAKLRFVDRDISDRDAVIVFSHADREYSGRVAVTASPRPDRVDDAGMAWDIGLDARSSTRISVQVTLTINGRRLPRTHGISDFGRGARALMTGPDVLSMVVPRLRTSWERLYRVYYRSLGDLQALLINNDPQLAAALPAAGLPWFMTVFGRDTLLTSFQLLPGGQWLGWGALETLAALQATVDDPGRDAQAGKIVHELRSGPVAVNEKTFPYYGSVDAPMLFLVLLSEVWRWTADHQAARRLRPAAEAVLRWMERDADVDGDGFIEYQRRAPRGLESQSWKDSWDAMKFHDGTIAHSPIATSEVQGYAYDAYIRTAEVARVAWDDPELAARLEARAVALRDRFNERFWSDDRGGFYHLALDHAKRPVDSITSNMGHLLWSGIVPEERSGKVAAQLMGTGLFSGWGIRTMSSDEAGYNPISYHCGTVWPHDNSIAVAGLHRYGFHDEANRVMVAMLDASQNFLDSRLPEVFAGYAREVGPFPVQYPTASSPQAWAAGAPLLMLRAALGAQPDPVTRTVSIDPHLPDFVHELEMVGCPAFGKLFDVEVVQGTGFVRESSIDLERVSGLTARG